MAQMNRWRSLAASGGAVAAPKADKRRLRRA
jgi:hypothetical protein